MTQPISQIRSGTLYMYVNDHLGAPQRLIKTNGNTVWQATQTAFGEATVTASSTLENNLRFPGQYYDQETGTHYNYYRDYEPGLGRYLQSDPIGLAGGLNTYTYVANNPSIHFDSYGLFLCDLLAKIPSYLEGNASAGLGGGVGASVDVSISSEGVDLGGFAGFAFGAKGSWQPNVNGIASKSWNIGGTDRDWNVGTEASISYGQGVVGTAKASVGTNGLDASISGAFGSGFFGGIGFKGDIKLIDCSDEKECGAEE